MSTIDLSTLSTAGLEAELKRRKQAAAQQAKEVQLAFETDKDSFVRETLGCFEALHQAMSELKQETMKRAEILYKRMYALSGKTAPAVSSFTLNSRDGALKVVIERAERFEFTESAVVHIQAIKDIFREKFQERNKGFYTLLDSILMRGKKREYDPKLLSKARQQVKQLGDKALVEAFDRLEDCQRVVGSSKYCRVYRRDENGRWEDISLQFSSL